jgi:TonB-dependent SusC/RagA subfamily outer membrane receptor
MSKMWGLLATLVGVELLVGAGACAKHGSSQPRPSGADSVEIGFGAQPKDKVLGAATTLPPSVSSRSLRIEEMLRGKVPGLVISGTGNSLTMHLRGTNSINSEQEPLVIVDDVMIQTGNIGNALAGLSPDDIKSVTVLKDVASTSIYGIRGGGGVILIKTKKLERPERSH